MFENVREDWRVYDGNLKRQGLWIMIAYRFGRWRYRISNRWIRLPFSIVYKALKLGGEILAGIEIPCEAHVGSRLVIEHFGGIVVSGDAVIGDDVVIRNGVTIGLKTTSERGSPVIGDRVDIGAGAKLLGPISVGSDSVIGANAVVISDVPENSLAVGVPARVIPRKQKT